MTEPSHDPLSHALRTEAALDVLTEWLRASTTCATPLRIERALFLAETAYRSASRTCHALDACQTEAGR